MTVEQNVLQQHSQKHQQSLLNQLKEVTGTTDVRLLQQALQFCNGDLAGAAAFLTESSAKVPEQNEGSSHQTAQTGNDRHINVGSQADRNVIDLTGDDKDDLQRAIALSLEESSRAFRETGITDEEQAISRVLEASIAENKANLQQTGEPVWSDSPNPYERKRCENYPVGLKNVGNTCWFSAVIQSLFHLLEFQKLVLQFTPPARAHDLPRNQKEHQNLPFMQELRKLFSLMVGSKRKYVDPSHAVEILKEAFKSSDSQQQDVSEFTHKLLDWLEDAFQMKAEEQREGEQPRNPMVELFYGRFLAVGVHEGKKFENAEMFGQYPLQVNGFSSLHECLEAAMNEGEIESLHSENSAKSGQEHWFTELPPVLTLELSRFEFNQALGRPEKIHNKLEFPPLLYVDRYMDKNKEVTRMKREEIRRLKEHLTLLQQRLERYLSYGSGPKRCPLADVLEYTMEFAFSKPACSSLLENADANGAPPGGAAKPSQPAPSVTELDPVVGCEAPVNALPSQQRAPVHKPFTQSRLPPEEPAHPAPRHISEEELSVLESCLQRWRNEVEGDIRDLQRSIAKIQRTTELMYSEKAMMQVPYRLHAVLVHEGQANAGHYWAYIYSSRHRCWMKYNDVSVTESSWEELMRDSFGGYRNTSAYCLMYINDKKPFLIEEDSDEVTDQPLIGLDKLPADLRAYVKEDNRLFEEELRQWDALQEKRKARAVVPASVMGPSRPRKVESSPSAAPQQYMEQLSSLYTCEHLKTDTERVISQAAAEQDDSSPEAVLNAAIKAEYARLLHLAWEVTQPEHDLRIQYVMVYLIQNQAPKKILERTLLTQFTDPSLAYDERCKNIMKVARAKLDLIRPDEVNMEQYEIWHQEYRNFRETTIFLMIGLELVQKRSYVEALPYLIYSYQRNKALLSKGPYRGHDAELIAHHRRACLLKLNEQAAALFEYGEEPEVSDGLNIMNQLVVPGLPLLLTDGDKEKDVAAVEDIRNRWCSYLGREMDPKLQETLTDFLPKLLDCSTEMKSFSQPPRLPAWSTPELCARFSHVMTSLRRTPADGR
ncbi:ubiquitin carboxyl-terminal hydrolase 25-like isoform X3 [Paramormyrops kingsleyae]|uniref:Ubiquitin carboxyl-terminal hydrolase 25 n=1 Tax=Paramormyrops kingsleyae TaxID=1676925 RepID=A0A3B3SC24_9TELE|nr:ubiquitin carboxyl-terminal hydrolase 25-like isoform X6 [Paramormyrops kingsleyae]